MLLERIDALRHELRSSEQKVANTVMRLPQRVLSCRMSDLAREAGVSDPSVVRFCRAIGFDSFGEFKLRLAQDLAVSRSDQFRISQIEFSPDDTVASAGAKVFAASLDCLVRLRDAMDFVAIERAALAIARARQVEIYGFGASAIVAQDAAHRLFRLVPGVIARSDPHTQAMATAALGPEDVVLAISHTGKTKDLLDIVQLASSVGATTIGLTHTASPLSEAVDITIGADVEENTDLYMPMVSRLAHLVAIDVLTLAVTLQLPPAARQRLKAMKRALQPKRLQVGGSHA